MEANAIEDISIALGLYGPFINESNSAFTSLETWQQLSALLVTQPLRIKPLGYYRTPHSVDIYVFECIMGDTSGSRRYSWKIYRRYRQFQKYISHSTELEVNRLVEIPRLSQGPVKIFHECNCRDRLVELTNWLEEVVEKTQDYYSQLKRRQEGQDRDKLCALQQRRMAQMVGEKTANRQVKAHVTAKSPIVPSTSTLKKLLGNSSIIQIRQPSRQSSLKAIEEQGDPALYVLRTDNSEALPVMMLSSFLLAGANCPFPHVFKDMPMFALALNERNVQLERVARSAYPSRLKNSMRTRAGLGLRLTPSQEQDGQYLGATVAGFLRNKNELDPALVDIPVGARLVRVNGIDVNDVPFDQVLIQLRKLEHRSSKNQRSDVT
uniref:PX domain-containing protein n=1 Tax=Hyaloperonospora arabidopsidis (strain Emoy2) TaxID=559515 RepID=M4BWF0_HYAAE